jgi:hypothetical protein
VLFGRFAIVRFLLAPCCALRTFRFAAVTCFLVAIAITSTSALPHREEVERRVVPTR